MDDNNRKRPIGRPKKIRDFDETVDLLQAIRQVQDKSTWDQRFSLNDLSIFASNQLRMWRSKKDRKEIKYWFTACYKLADLISKLPMQDSNSIEIVFKYLTPPVLPLTPPNIPTTEDK
jgi:hypothetical protein